LRRLFPIILLLLPAGLCARQVASLQSGSWTATSTWSTNSAPAAGDTLTINQGHTVTITANHNYNTTKMAVLVKGTWRFSGAGAKVSFPCNSIVVIYPDAWVLSHNGEGNNQTIRICNTTYWSAEDRDVEGPWGWPYNILPVDLVEFGAKPSALGVSLAWTTASERGAERFDVYRSTDLADWSLTGSTPAAGDSHATTRYALEDPNVPPGQWYYKLVLVDRDGGRPTEALAGVLVEGRDRPLVCAPNPVTGGRTSAILDGPVGMDAPPMVVGAGSGSAILRPDHRWEGGALAIELPGLRSGTYVLVLSMHGRQRACRFVVER